MSARYSRGPRLDMHERSLDVFCDLGDANTVDPGWRQDIDASAEELPEELLQIREIVVGGRGELHDKIQIARIRLRALGIRAEERDGLDAEALQFRPMAPQSLKDVRSR